VCHDTYTAHQAVEHDDLNVLCIGARVVGSALACEIVDAFLRASFSREERHQRRLNKILAIESRYLARS
jgi:ribose 5-phosphate isomerase B